MAVVQISKIQIRRGRKNSGTGLPQLSSGELGWAVDTQELYIGNGAVSEGAPQVGNTKILTEKDDLFEIAKDYTYKDGDGSVVTGPDATNPVIRTLQDRLDDRVSVKAFGATGQEGQNATVLLQRAIDQLYLNNGAEVSVNDRVELHLEAGTYTIFDTIRIPPHATIIGAGPGKTIIKQENPNVSVFTTVSDESTPENYVLDGQYATQARNILIKGMTLQTTDISKGLVLQSCRDSAFQDLTIVGPWIMSNSIPADSSTTFNIGLSLNSKNGGVESVRNEFTNCHIDGFAYGIVSNWDINDNVFTTCNFSTLGYGVAFGKDMLVDGNQANGTSTGPHNNIFSDCVFTNTKRHAILVEEGTYNVSRANKFVTCANDGGPDDMPMYPVIRYGILGNESINDYFTRTKVLSYTQGAIITGTANILAGQLTVTVADTTNLFPGQLVVKQSGAGDFASAAVVIVSVDSATQFTVNANHLTSGSISFEVQSPIMENVVYLPEVEGPSNFEWGFEHQVTIQTGQNNTLFRLPQMVNQSFDIDYIAVGESGYNGMRSGKLRLVVNSNVDGGAGTPSVYVTDDYDYLGDNLFVDNISFDATLVDIDNDGTFDTVVVKSNTVGSLPSNATTKFKFRVQTKQTDI